MKRIIAVTAIAAVTALVMGVMTSLVATAEVHWSWYCSDDLNPCTRAYDAYENGNRLEGYDGRDAEWVDGKIENRNGVTVYFGNANSGGSNTDYNGPPSWNANQWGIDRYTLGSPR